MADRDERLGEAPGQAEPPAQAPRPPGPGTTPGATPPDDVDIPTGAAPSGELRSPENSPAPVDE